jgi:hypothetical protein
MALSRARALALAGPAFIAVAFTAGCAGSDASTADGPTDQAADGETVNALEGVRIEIRRDPGCGCCTSWAEYLRKHGAAVELSEDSERQAFRTQQGVPDDAASCHTAVVHGYTIEGHVPTEAIQHLLAERPDAIGLALPGMPADSPGMGGDNTTWARLPVMLIDSAGQLVPFDY